MIVKDVFSITQGPRKKILLAVGPQSKQRQRWATWCGATNICWQLKILV